MNQHQKKQSSFEDIYRDLFLEDSEYDQDHLNFLARRSAQFTNLSTR